MRKLKIFVVYLLVDIAHGYLYSYPVFQQFPAVKRSRVGKSLEFNCEVDEPHARLYWEFNGQRIENNDSFHIIPVGRTSTLFIIKVLPELEGVYCCNYFDGVKIFTECGQLIVKRGPTISKEPSSRSAYFKDDVTFNCTVDSYPRSNIAWLHNGTIVCREKTNKECRQNPKDVGPQVGFLKIKNITHHDAGLYQCKAMNNLSTTYSNFAVLIVEDRVDVMEPMTRIAPAEIQEISTGFTEEAKSVSITTIEISTSLSTTTVNPITSSTQLTGTMDYYHLSAMNDTSHKVFSYSDEDYHDRLPSPNSTILIVLFLGLALIVMLAVFIFCVSRNKLRHKKADERMKIARIMSQKRLAQLNEQNMLRELRYPVDDLEVIQELGEGVFGLVFKAKAPGLLSPTETTTVAVKTIRSTDATEYSKVEDFNREAEMLATFQHKNIVQLLGVCVDNDSQSDLNNISCLLFEYVDGGDLCAYLRNRGPNQALFHSRSKEMNGTISDEDKLLICTHIACGMQYLSERNFIHRDLATRNCLISERDLNIKISDFGLSRRTYESDYYKAGETESVPIRWMSPEAILYGKYSSQSDVWAYGITLWEIYSYALQPYFSLTNEDVICCVCKNQILPCPSDTPTWIYNLMKLCWQNVPDERPNFTTIHSVLQAIGANDGKLPMSDILLPVKTSETTFGNVPPNIVNSTEYAMPASSSDLSVLTIPPPMEFDSSGSTGCQDPLSSIKTRSKSMCGLASKRSTLSALNDKFDSFPPHTRSISVLNPPVFHYSTSNHGTLRNNKNFFYPINLVTDARSDSCLPESPTSSLNYGSDKESVV
uniref:fibroblast growth factor receptor 1-like isoform X1 n=1 Tax=Styela clava TaxID=7725 RepID=UPI00193A7AEB|nr:fibroblast growth factor receptor 1-like isoform X1 [Styela clava]